MKWVLDSSQQLCHNNQYKNINYKLHLAFILTADKLPTAERIIEEQS